MEEQCRAAFFAIGRRCRSSRERPILMIFAYFAPQIPKIFSACGALLGRLRRAATAPPAGSRPLTEERMVRLSAAVQAPTCGLQREP